MENNTADTLNPKQACLDWYYEQPDPSEWNRVLGTCPCAFSQRGGGIAFSRRLGQDLIDSIENQNGKEGDFFLSY